MKTKVKVQPITVTILVERKIGASTYTTGTAFDFGEFTSAQNCYDTLRNVQGAVGGNISRGASILFAWGRSF